MEDLGSWLDDISSRDSFLKTVPKEATPADLPPVRGAPPIQEVARKAPPPPTKPEKPAASAPEPKPKKKDDAAIWDEEELPTAPADPLARSASFAAPTAEAGTAQPVKPVKPRQRKHACAPQTDTNPYVDAAPSPQTRVRARDRA